MRKRILLYSVGLLVLLSLAVLSNFGELRAYFAPQNAKSGTTPEQNASRPPGSAVAAPKPTLDELRKQARAVKANELGQVPILVYHLIGSKEERWTRTPENLRKDLAELNRRGYVTVSLTDYLTGNINIPAGKSPAVLTFDDSTPGHFRLIEKNGELTVDPNCAVGILRDFAKQHPGFGNAATFFINARPFCGEQGQEKYWQKKLQMLVEWGFEIGNHTMHHLNLKNQPPQKIRQEIAGLQALIQQAVPGYTPSAFAIVQDGLPQPYDTVVQGTYNGTTYHHSGVVWWAWSAARSPYHKEFDPLRLQRIQVFQDHGVSSLTTWLDRIEPTRYVSDGNPGTIAFPQGWEQVLVEKQNAKVITYQAEKSERTPEREQQALNAKGVHVTFSWASSQERWRQVIDLVKATGLNTIQLDVKDESGRIGYLSEVQLSRDIGAAQNYLKIRDLLRELRAEGIYSVARIVVIRDPVLAKKRPDLMVRTASGYPLSGGVWVNPCSREVWDYNIALAKEAYALGFDEVQFDYLRFPEGTNAWTSVYPGMGNRHRTDVITGFVRYAREQIGWEKWLSVAVFGFMGYAKDDQKIGQRPERLAPFLDFLSPMAYPSHYSPGNYGFSNPNAHPYEVVDGTLSDFEKLIDTSGCRLRPWLQAFTLGPPPFGPAEIKAQMKATVKHGIQTWLLWNPCVIYRPEALQQ
ncbi:MAG: putative glycoside hydrolase [Bacillota bacterium]